MNVEQCYALFGGNYAETFARLGKVALIKKLLIKFLSDNSIEQLKSCIENGQCEESFRICHTLKGVALNMGFTELARTSSNLTELFRAGSMEGYEPLLADMEHSYNLVKDTISKVDE